MSILASLKLLNGQQYCHNFAWGQIATRYIDPMDCRPAGSSVYGISQARILVWVAIFFSRNLPKPGIEPGSLTLQADSLPSEPPGSPDLLW